MVALQASPNNTESSPSSTKPSPPSPPPKPTPKKTSKTPTPSSKATCNHSSLKRGEGWAQKPLGEIAEFKNGLNFSQSSKGQSVRLVGVGDFQENYFLPLSGLKRVTIDGDLGEQYAIRQNDILTVRSNGSQGFSRPMHARARRPRNHFVLWIHHPHPLRPELNRCQIPASFLKCRRDSRTSRRETAVVQTSATSTKKNCRRYPSISLLVASRVDC